jgi:hydrogenase maturation protease
MGDKVFDAEYVADADREATGSAVVIGIGHPDRGDDAIGRLVAARLRGRVPEEVTVVDEDGEATRLVDRLGRAASAILVDASVSGAAVGTIHRFDAARDPLPEGKPGMSTHGFGLATAIELARVLGSLPRRCIVYAVEARSFVLGDALSPEVAAAADEVVERVLADLRVGA